MKKAKAGLKKDYESWGSEYVEEPYTYNQRSNPLEALRSESEALWGDHRMIHRDILEQCVQPNQYRYCYTSDMDRTNLIRTQIEKEGLQEPLEILISEDGKMVLRDGHHRLFATKDLGYQYLPCRFTEVETLRASGAQKISKLLLILLGHSSQK